jgi:hypothetical protein
LVSSTSKLGLGSSSSSTTKCDHNLMNLVTLKSAAKLRHMFNKLAFAWLQGTVPHRVP